METIKNALEVNFVFNSFQDVNVKCVIFLSKVLELPELPDIPGKRKVDHLLLGDGAVRKGKCGVL